MAEIETLGILDEIQSIVSDKLQVVSYKWLSRNFLVSSNSAKRLLEEFVKKYGNGLQVIYSLSGWLKNNSSTYHIRLVPQHKLSDAKKEFDENCSIQVYSVQACLPKDPATLWNHEFVQAEVLFKQPLSADNCLRDNRFGAVSNSFVKRTAEETPREAGKLQPSTTGITISSKAESDNHSRGIPLPQQKKDQQLSPKVGVQSPDISKTVKTESHIKIETDKEKVAQLPYKTKKGQSDKNSSGSEGALASMWGRASKKPKPDAENPRQNSAASADAQICVRESVEHGSSDEEGQDFNIKRASNGESSRKRRVVFDYSDEEDEYKDVVSLASPDPPKRSTISAKDGSNTSDLERSLSFEEKENKTKIQDVKEVGAKANQQMVEKDVETSKSKKVESFPTAEKTLNHVPEADATMKDKVADAGPKRRKVVKTRIDERGREVTEVVWEGEEPDTKSDNNSAKLAENSTVNNAMNRPPVARKSPTVGNTAPANQAGKAGNKKAGNKDPKQGNILSFFKKV